MNTIQYLAPLVFVASALVGCGASQTTSEEYDSQGYTLEERRIAESLDRAIEHLQAEPGYNPNCPGRSAGEQMHNTRVAAELEVVMERHRLIGKHATSSHNYVLGARFTNDVGHIRRTIDGLVGDCR